MEYKNEELGIFFELPAVLTVAQMLEYRAALTDTSKTVYERLFRYGASIATRWECEAIPNPQTIDFNEDTRPVVSSIVIYVANNTAGHMDERATVPKN